VLGAFQLPLTNAAQPSWFTELAAGQRVTALAAQSEGSVVYAAAQRADGSSTLVSCTVSGGCPAIE
jgi:hypothetical protein